MAYDREHVYVTWGGTLGSVENEIWQNGVRLAPAAKGSTPAFPTAAQGAILMTSMQNQWALSTNQTMNWCKLKWLKFSKIGLLGNLIGEPLLVPTTPPAGVAGPQTSVGHPYQVALTVTLWSGSTYGKANYGRFYLPAPAFASSVDGQISGSTVASANWVGTWLKNIETSAAGWPAGVAPMFVHIMGQAAVSADATSNRVLKVRIGDKMDTQRRRRNKIREIYTESTTYP